MSVTKQLTRLIDFHSGKNTTFQSTNQIWGTSRLTARVRCFYISVIKGILHFFFWNMLILRLPQN